MIVTNSALSHCFSTNGANVVDTKAAEPSTLEDDDEDEEPEEEEVHVIDDNDAWLNSTTAVPKAAAKPLNVSLVSESKAKQSIKEKAMASLEVVIGSRAIPLIRIRAHLILPSSNGGKWGSHEKTHRYPKTIFVRLR